MQNGTSQRQKILTNKWAVRIEGGEIKADEIAEMYGFHNLGPIIPGSDFFLFENRMVRKRALRRSRHLNAISHDQNVCC